MSNIKNMGRRDEVAITRMIFDVDGVFTTGQFLYTNEGKFAKIFGPHDADGIKLLKQHVTIEAISADKRGWDITKRRMNDMELPVTLVPELEREVFFSQLDDLDTVAYMGDGIYDARVFSLVSYGVAPGNAHPLAREAADFVTEARSGEGAVAEACLHIMDLFFEKGRVKRQAVNVLL